MNLLMTIGLPGSGKSTWVKNYIKDKPMTFVICRDDIRRMGMAGDYVFYGAREPMIMLMSRRMIKAAITYGYDVVVDETLLKRCYRQELAKVFRDMTIGLGSVNAVYFNTPVDVCISRCCLLDTKGSMDDCENVIINMNRNFEPPTPEEFDGLEVIDYKSPEGDVRCLR